jgi:hypothetical protein
LVRVASVISISVSDGVNRTPVLAPPPLIVCPPRLTVMWSAAMVRAVPAEIG